LIHSDAVQAIGKIPVHFRDLGIDAMTFTPHKFHGPRSIGGLLLRHEIQPNPMLFGGFQQMGTRPGTEDVALVVGAAKALEIYEESGVESAEHMRKLRQLLQSNIQVEFNDVVINGLSVEGDPDDNHRVPHTLNLSFPRVNRQAFLMAADLNGLAISTGSACASGSSEPSHVLIAMGAKEEVIEGSIRISLGIHTTVAEIVQASRRIIKIVKDLRR
jgi:cysteine desulfurase